MKKIILLGAFVIAFAVQAQDNTAFKNDAIELIKATGVDSAFDDAIAQLGGNVAEAKKEEYVKEAKGTLADLYSKMAKLYMTEFTQAEVKELLAFYKTDLGKKMASKQLVISQKGMLLGQAWGFEVQGIAQKYVGTVNATPEKTN
ncbi:MAG: DUF2059 domain-containing protein [Flavobacteriaceae bacterium]|nr:DUF2059 domain-containing protein [Flavobacteriaceae bacterium]